MGLFLDINNDALHSFNNDNSNKNWPIYGWFVWLVMNQKLTPMNLSGFETTCNFCGRKQNIFYSCNSFLQDHIIHYNQVEIGEKYLLFVLRMTIYLNCIMLHQLIDTLTLETVTRHTFMDLITFIKLEP